MSRDELHELAALYAVDLLDGDERKAFETELEGNPHARAALEKYSEASDLLAYTAEPVEPPEELEERIFSQIDKANGAQPPPVVEAGGDLVKGPAEVMVNFSWIPWGVAAACVITSLVVWSQNSKLSDRIARAEWEHDQAVEQLVAEHSRELRSLEREFSQKVETLIAGHSHDLDALHAEIRQLESDGALQNLRIAILKSKLESAPNAQAVAVWNASQQVGRLTVSELPAVSDDQDYQLWIIDPAYESPVSAGVFNTDAEGALEYTFSGSESISTINAFALSLESKGGNPAPKGPIVLVGE